MALLVFPGSVPVDEKVMYRCLASLFLELPVFATHIWRPSVCPWRAEEAHLEMGKMEQVLNVRGF